MKTKGGLSVRETMPNCARSRKKETQLDEALDHSLIADLSNKHIHQMKREELVRVILAAKLDFLDLGGWQRVSHFDQATLERLAYLARYCSQNQILRASKSRKHCHAYINTKN